MPMSLVYTPGGAWVDHGPGCPLVKESQVCPATKIQELEERLKKIEEQGEDMPEQPYPTLRLQHGEVVPVGNCSGCRLSLAALEDFEWVEWQIAMPGRHYRIGNVGKPLVKNERGVTT